MQKRFKPKLSVTIFVIIGMVIFCALGIWQLQRYQYKKTVLTRYQRALKNAPVNLEDLKKGSVVDYQHVRVQGIFLNDYTVLVDNKMHNGRSGYEVFTPLLISGTNQLILINRGWLAATGTGKSSLPAIKPVFGEKTLTGFVQTTGYKAFIMGKNALSTNKWPLIVQKVDVKRLQRRFHRPLYPFVIQLDATIPYGFMRNWNPSKIIPQKHLGYAMLWFALALVLLVVYFILSRRAV